MGHALNGKLPYLFSAGSPQPGSAGSPSENAQRVIISQYLSATDAPNPADRILTLQPEPLRKLLNFYKVGRRGHLPSGTAELADVDVIWAVFTQNRVPMAYVSARRYLAERDAEVQRLRGCARLVGGDQADRQRLGVGRGDHRPARRAPRAPIARPGAGQRRAVGAGGPLVADLGRRAVAWGENPYFDFLNEQLTDATSYPAGTGLSPGRRPVAEGRAGRDQGRKRPDVEPAQGRGQPAQVNCPRLQGIAGGPANALGHKRAKTAPGCRV